jgi:hypothetical protein
MNTMNTTNGMETIGSSAARKKIANEITKVHIVATSIIVKDNDSYAYAGDMLVTIKKVKKNIEEYFRPLKAAAHAAWKQICNRENEEIEKLTPALKHLDMQMTAYNIEQEKIRKAEEERLRREAEKAEQEARLQAAIEAEKAGQKEEAEAILEEPVFVPPPIVDKTVPKQAGLAMTTNWEAKIIDEHLIPRQYLMPDMVKINQVVRALKDKTNIPGIMAIPRNSMRGVRR